MSTQPAAALHEHFFLVKEAAQILRRSVKRTYAMLEADPSFPRTKLPGGGVLIPRAAFEKWLQGRTEGMRAPLRLAVIPKPSEASSTHDGAGALNGTA